MRAISKQAGPSKKASKVVNSTLDKDAEPSDTEFRDGLHYFNFLSSERTHSKSTHVRKYRIFWFSPFVRVVSDLAGLANMALKLVNTILNNDRGPTDGRSFAYVALL